MRVLHVSGLIDPAYGGPSVTTIELVQALARAGLDVELATTDRSFRQPRRHQPQLAGPIPLAVHRAHWPRGYNASVSLARDLIHRTKQFDLVHIHSIYGMHTLVAAAAARIAGVPYICEPHGALTRYHHRQKRAKKAVHERLVDLPALRGAAFIRCASPSEANDLVSIGLRERTTVIPHGVVCPWPTSSLGQRDAGREGHVLFLGRIHHKKRLDITLEAFAELRRREPCAVLAVVGEGDAALMRSLEEQVRALGLETSVVFWGPVYGDERWELYNDADVFVLLSDDESFGVTAIEAAAMGVPVVATRSVSSAIDLSRIAPVTIVPPDPAIAAEALLDALRSPSDRMTTAASVRARYGWDGIAEEMIDLYTRVAINRSRGLGEPR